MLTTQEKLDAISKLLATPPTGDGIVFFIGETEAELRRRYEELEKEGLAEVKAEFDTQARRAGQAVFGGKGAEQVEAYVTETRRSVTYAVEHKYQEARVKTGHGMPVADVTSLWRAATEQQRNLADWREQAAAILNPPPREPSQ